MPKTMTLDRFLVERQRRFPEATGRFTQVMAQIGTAAKIVANSMRRAPLEGLLGTTGGTNVQGEEIKRLDELGNRVFLEAFEYVDIVGMMISEEMSEVKRFEPQLPADAESYVVMLDPVDGSSNIDVNGIVGSIFSVHRMTGDSVEASCLKPGRQQVAAGYVMYGSSTVLVYSAGVGVHSFVLDDDIGEFLLERADIVMPASGTSFAANLGYYHLWDAPPQRVADRLMALDATPDGPYSMRYSGALLADLHAILMRGGLYFYPADRDRPDGKLRLLYECAPLAFLADCAGGAATTGTERILDVAPREIHQRVPFAIGSKREIELYEAAFREG